MKTLTLNKVVTAVAVLTLVFTQVVPAGFALSIAPRDQEAGTAVPTPVVAATEAASAQAQPVSQSPAAQTTTGFLADQSPLSVSRTSSEVAARPRPPMGENIPASRDLVARAQEVFGDRVVRGETTVSRGIVGAANVTRFYDAAGNLVGSYTNNPSLGPSNVPTWKNDQGTVVAREIPASSELLAEAQDVLGADVVRGVALVRENIVGAATVTRFYDANGDLKGSYTTNPSLGPDNVPTWKDPNGNIIEKKIPPAVTEYVRDLQSRLGGEYLVTVTRSPEKIWPPRYLVSVLYAPKALRQGQFRSMVVKINTDGSFVSVQGEVVYDGIKGADGQLLYEGLLKITSDPVYLMATGLKLRSASNNEIFFDHKDYVYKIYRNSEGKVVLEKGFPVVVQNVVDALRAQFGPDFSITVSTIKCKDGEKCDGSYLIQVSYLPKVLRTGRLRSVSLSLGTQGEIRGVSNVQFDGIANLDGRLLYEALHQLPYMDGRLPIQSLDPNAPHISALAEMSRLTIHKVETDGSVHFQIAGDAFRAYRNPEGRVILERELPPAVREYIENLQRQVGDGFRVTARRQADSSFLVTIADSKMYIQAPTEGLHQMSFVLRSLDICSQGPGGTCTNAGYVVDAKSIQAVYYAKGGDIKVDGRLLFLAMGVCPQDMVCTANLIGDVERLVRMSRATVFSVDKDGAIHFWEGDYYKAFRDKNGNVVVVKEFPAAVQAFVQSLQAQLGKEYILKVMPSPEKILPPRYLVSVRYAPKVLRPGQFRNAVVKINADGSFAGLQGEVVFDGIKSVDGKMLFEAMAVCPEGQSCPKRLIGDMEKLVRMSKVTISSVDPTGAIFYSLAGTRYKAFRDAAGTIRVVTVPQLFVEPKPRVSAILR